MTDATVHTLFEGVHVDAVMKQIFLWEIDVLLVVKNEHDEPRKRPKAHFFISRLCRHLNSLAQNLYLIERMVLKPFSTTSRDSIRLFKAVQSADSFMKPPQVWHQDAVPHPLNLKFDLHACKIQACTWTPGDNEMS